VPEIAKTPVQAGVLLTPFLL